MRLEFLIDTNVAVARSDGHLSRSLRPTDEASCYSSVRCCLVALCGLPPIPTPYYFILPRCGVGVHRAAQ